MSRDEIYFLILRAALKFQDQKWFEWTMGWLNASNQKAASARLAAERAREVQQAAEAAASAAWAAADYAQSKADLQAEAEAEKGGSDAKA